MVKWSGGQVGYQVERLVIRWTGGKVERWTDGQADRGGRCSGEAFVEDEEVLTNDGEDEVEEDLTSLS